MKDHETHQKFIQLRSQGWSFARIAQELNVARGTLINWSRKFQFEINNLRALEMESLQEQLLTSRETRARALGDYLKQVEEELKKRNLAEVSTSRLFTIADSLRRQIQRETGDLRFTSPVDEIPDEEYHEQVQDWSA
jgi:hypothetical protein